MTCSCGAAASEGRSRRIVRARSGGLCEVCLTARAQSMHHRLKAGRIWCPCNLLDVCGDGTRGCHGRIEANPDEAKNVYGWWVEPGAAAPPPHLVPVWIARWGWVLLDAAGDYDLQPHITSGGTPSHAR